MADTHRAHPLSIAYVDPRIDRAVTVRADAARVDALLKGSTARLVPVWKQRHPVIMESDGGLRPRYLTFDEAAPHLDMTNLPPVFLGMVNDTPWFAMSLPSWDALPHARESDFRILHDFVSFVPTDEATLMAYARGMVIWHENHKYCGRCGAFAAVTEGGHSRTCMNTTCGHRSFPRTDPAIITLIEHPDGDRCLLGRQPSWPAGFYSTVAGFVEPGESLEGAVIREVREETGVTVGDVRYIASQPWPFPSSIMLGFRARAITTDIHMDDEELEDCRWFTRTEVAEFGERTEDSTRPFKAPPPFSISRFLINGWLEDR